MLIFFSLSRSCFLSFFSWSKACFFFFNRFPPQGGNNVKFYKEGSYTHGGYIDKMWFLKSLIVSSQWLLGRGGGEGFAMIDSESNGCLSDTSVLVFP